MLLVEEVELGAACINRCKAVHEQVIFIEIGNPQVCTQIIIDNTTIEGINNKKSIQAHKNGGHTISLASRLGGVGAVQIQVEERKAQLHSHKRIILWHITMK